MNSKHLTDYLKYKSHAWRETTLKTTASKLESMSKVFDAESPVDMFFYELSDKKDYTKAIYFNLCSGFYDYLVDQGIEPKNPFKMYRKSNPSLFKNSYQKKLPELTYAEALRRIDSMTSERARLKARELLASGLRLAESHTIKDGLVLGKGGKIRATIAEAVDVSDCWLRMQLREVGLHPHMLRKITATELNRQNVSLVDICQMMGWSQLQTAKSYIAPAETDRLNSILKRTFKNANKTIRSSKCGT